MNCTTPVAEYWTTYKPECEKPEAFIKIVHQKAWVVAGDLDSEMAFKSGKPNTIKFPSLIFQLVGHLRAYHTLI